MEKQRSVDLKTIDWHKEEAKFKRLLGEKGMRIIEVGTDGNCLFRAIAHLAYGDEDEHRLVRLKCMEYIEQEREFFQDFIVGGQESFE
jgi:OTU domain-containing protein 5